MLKYVTLVFLLISCSPKFEEGACLQAIHKNLEHWQMPNTTMRKVDKINENIYLTYDLVQSESGDYWHRDEKYKAFNEISFFEQILYKQVPCPKIKEIK